MAHEKNHDYHILEPSVLPFIGAVSGFVMLFGAVLWMQDITWIMFAMGFVGVMYVMFAWWTEVVRESNVGDHTPVVRLGLRYGFIMFIMSEIMFFSAWFWSFFKHGIYPMHPDGISPAVDGVWPPAGIETFDPWHLPLINTLILLCSGAAATWARQPSAPRVCRSRPWSSSSPASGSRRPVIKAARVDLPLPDGPSRSNRSPGAMSS